MLLFCSVSAAACKSPEKVRSVSKLALASSIPGASSVIRVAFAQRQRAKKGSPRRPASIPLQHIEWRLLGSPALRAGRSGEKEREPEVLPLISASTDAGSRARSDAAVRIFSDLGKNRDDMSYLEGARKESACHA